MNYGDRVSYEWVVGDRGKDKVKTIAQAEGVFLERRGSYAKVRFHKNGKDVTQRVPAFKLKPVEKV